MKRKAHGSIHHVIPISRRGGQLPQNEMKLDADVHDAWHVLFGNLLIEEVIGLIKYVWQDEYGRIREKYLIGELKKNKKGREKDKRLFAWQIIFGDCRNAKEAVIIIKEIFKKRI